MLTRHSRLASGALMIVALIGAPVTRSTPKKTKDATKSDATPLIAAASNCKLDEVNALLKKGADIKARDGAGRDALTFASLQRDKHLDLVCPEVVVALTKAGADPMATKFYQSPELDSHQPTEIALLRVEDARSANDKKKVKIEDLAHGVEEALSQRRLRMSNHGYVAGGIDVLVAPASYPVLKFNETREKLTAGGFSEDDLAHPDRKRACSILGTEAVFEVVLKNYEHADIGIMTGSQASLEFWLTDCRTGELLWKNDPGAVMEERGFIARGFIGGNYRILTEMGLSMPWYRGPKK